MASGFFFECSEREKHDISSSNGRTAREHACGRREVERGRIARSAIARMRRFILSASP